MKPPSPCRRDTANAKETDCPDCLACDLIWRSTNRAATLVTYLSSLDQQSIGACRLRKLQHLFRVRRDVRSPVAFTVHPFCSEPYSITEHLQVSQFKEDQERIPSSSRRRGEKKVETIQEKCLRTKIVFKFRHHLQPTESKLQDPWVS